MSVYTLCIPMKGRNETLNFGTLGPWLPQNGVLWERSQKKNEWMNEWMNESWWNGLFQPLVSWLPHTLRYIHEEWNGGYAEPCLWAAGTWCQWLSLSLRFGYLLQARVYLYVSALNFCCSYWFSCPSRTWRAEDGRSFLFPLVPLAHHWSYQTCY